MRAFNTLSVFHSIDPTMKSKLGSNSTAGNGIRPRSSQASRSMAINQLLFILLDLCCNFVVDCSATDPTIVLIFFALQMIALIVNFMFYVLGSVNQAMQTGLRKTTMLRHELNLLTLITYAVLTCCAYVWTLRRAWPSVSNQFSFSFSTTGTNDSANGLTRDDRFREYYTLWSPGYIALYAVQRTVAVFYYVLFAKAIFLTIDVNSEDAGARGLDELPERSGYPYLETVSGLLNNRDHEAAEKLKPKIHLNHPGTRSSSRMETYLSPVHHLSDSSSQAPETPRPVRVLKPRPRRGPSSSSETEY